jgi:hypothetical protein
MNFARMAWFSGLVHSDCVLEELLEHRATLLLDQTGSATEELVDLLLRQQLASCRWERLGQ